MDGGDSRRDRVPEPPFWGSRDESAIALDEVLPCLNRQVLYQARWGFTARGPRSAGREVEARRAAEVELERLLALGRERGLFACATVHGYFPCHAAGDDLVVLAPPASAGAAPGGELGRFHFPGRRRRPPSSLAGFFLPAGQGPDLLALQLVTVGERVAEALRELDRQGAVTEMFLLHGLAGELAEALAELRHRRVRQELGIAAGEGGEPADLFRGRYRGRRISFGYPGCPGLEEQTLLFELLRPQRIGVRLSASFQLVPEHSTSALILHHPRASRSPG